MTDVNSTVDVVEPCTAGTTRYFPTPAVPAVIPICDAAQYRGTGPDSGYIIGLGRVDAAVPVLHVVFKVNDTPGNYTDDAFLVLPKRPDRRGSAYWSLGHRKDGRWLATADTATTLNYKDCSDSTATPVNLLADDVFQLSCGSGTALWDGTGSRVYSTGGENFGFISGATCGTVPWGGYACDVLAEMQPGEDWWGTKYFVTEFNKAIVGSKGDLIRIVSTTAMNVATFTPVSGGVVTPNWSSLHGCNSPAGHAFANAGDWCDIIVQDGATITANSGIVVGQLMKGKSDAGVGDPSLSLVLPSEPSRFRCGGPFFVFDGFSQDASGNGNYVNIVAPTAVIGGIKLDNFPLSSTLTCGGYSPVAFGASGYSWTKCLLADPAPGGSQHVLDSGSTPIGVYVYGQKDQGSYAYVAGMSF